MAHLKIIKVTKVLFFRSLLGNFVHLYGKDIRLSHARVHIAVDHLNTLENFLCDISQFQAV